MRRARSHGGITVPLNNGYSAKCIPDATMSQMNAGYSKEKLLRSRMSDGMPHMDENLLSVGQVGAFAAERMRMTDEGRPVWTDEIWNHFQDELEKGNDGGPPGYRNSGRSVSKGVEWALLNGLTSCGVAGDQCQTSVFSAISPWAEAIISSTMRRLSRTNTKITSVDFNPCVLEMNSTEHAPRSGANAAFVRFVRELFRNRTRRTGEVRRPGESEWRRLRVERNMAFDSAWLCPTAGCAPRRKKESAKDRHSNMYGEMERSRYCR